jgi:hypothetical protein
VRIVDTHEVTLPTASPLWDAVAIDSKRSGCCFEENQSE